jgi:MFS family permease
VSTTDYLNQLINSEQRATILSFASVMYSVVMILLFPLFGYLSDLIGMKNTFLVLGGMIFSFSIINLFSKEF